ncbi:uncharacterized protein [Penaeus vannamei]|uniref:uncharacterized protein n=1 Tax=Penaeus vannamei TaxID=6689 RepID=UPI00387F48DF
MELDAAVSHLEEDLRQACEDRPAMCNTEWDFEGESLTRTCLEYLIMGSAGREELAAQKRVYILSLEEEITRVMMTSTWDILFPLVGVLVYSLVGVVAGWRLYRWLRTRGGEPEKETQ